MERSMLYINDIPRHALALVFLIFGIDKFINTALLVSWLRSTERVTFLFPTQDLNLAVQTIGVIEIILAVLLFTGIKVRIISIITSGSLILIMATARYPSSLPQDLGLLGASILLILANASWKNARSDRFIRYSWIARYSIASVLIFWAIDQVVNYESHIGWIKIASMIGRSLPDASYIVTLLIVIEFILGGLLIYGRVKSVFIASTIFFIIAKLMLEPPLNNYQSIGLALISAWLALIEYKRLGIKM